MSETTSTERSRAGLLIAAVGLVGAYTIALALDQFATALEGESFEADKLLNPEEARDLALAILEQIPEEWQPEVTTEEEKEAESHADQSK